MMRTFGPSRREETAGGVPSIGGHEAAGEDGVTDWIETNLDRLYGFAFSLTQDSDRARDLVQECALKAIAARRQPTEAAAYRAWLFRILRHCFIDRHRKTAAEVQLDEGDDTSVDDGAVWTGERRLVDVITVRIAMTKLPVAHREIIGLVDIIGLTYAEAAEVLSIPEGTVMSRLSRARKALLILVATDNVTPLRTGGTSRGGG